MKNLYIVVLAIFALASCATISKINTYEGTLDRSIMPGASEAKALAIGNHQEFILENGMKVYVIENSKLPTISYSLGFDTDPIVEGAKAGYLSMTGSLIEAGTTNRTKQHQLEAAWW